MLFIEFGEDFLSLELFIFLLVTVLVELSLVWIKLDRGAEGRRRDQSGLTYHVDAVVRVVTLLKEVISLAVKRPWCIDRFSLETGHRLEH